MNRARRFVLLRYPCLAIWGPPAGADSGAPKHSVTVFAAASLTESFKAIGSAFEQAHPGLTVQFSFAGSSTLVQQISEERPAGVFASADESPCKGGRR